jgi:hypothetical protein
MEESKWVSVGPTIIKNSTSEYLREAIDSLVIFFHRRTLRTIESMLPQSSSSSPSYLQFHLSPSESEVQLPFRSSAAPMAAAASSHDRIPERGIAGGLGSAVPSTHPWRLRARGSSGVGEVGVDNRRKLGAHKGHIEGCGGWNRRGSSWIVVRGRRIRRAGLRIDPGLRPWLQAPAASSKAVQLRAGLRHAHRFVEVKS